jgi:hypothetical protein
MNNRKILIANLAKGQIGEQASNLLGSLLVSHLQLVAMARGELASEKRTPFFVHVDEFQNKPVNLRRTFAWRTSTSNRSRSMCSLQL